MEKGVIENILFLCIFIVSAIVVGAATAYVTNLKGDHDIRDPTYQEALQFIRSDQTDKNQYDQHYNCIYFANDFRNNALREEYKCGYVTIDFPETTHAIVCFNTSDNGLIFIEPQTDEIVTLTIGQQYLGMIILQFSITW